MPELPEVETVMRGLRPVMEGQRFAVVTVRCPRLRGPLNSDLAGRLEGRSVVTLARRAKYILMTLDDEQVLFLHLGMSGRMTIHKSAGLDRGGDNSFAPLGRHDHILFDMAGARGFETQIRFCDPRRFGMVGIADNRNCLPESFFRLGPEPLGNSFSGAILYEKFQGKKTTLKVALLDQGCVAGLGNIYVCEALNLSCLSPLRPAGSLAVEDCENLVQAIRQVLEQAIRAGGSSLRDYVQASGELGYFQHQWRVYGRAGEPCPTCGPDATIERIQQAGRSTFWCMACQR